MEKMRELYKKVAKDSALQAKFSLILDAAEKEGKEVTEAKLTAFAREAGYEVSIDEFKAFFKELADKEEGCLSESELDMVAGGKTIVQKGINIVVSVGTIGLACMRIVG